MDIKRYKLLSLKLHGYRPFGKFEAQFSPLEVIVGANGSGKSSLFEFLKFLRDSTYHEIPPEIVSGSIGQQIFHRPGPDKFLWSLRIDVNKPVSIDYQGELLGPLGRTHIAFERVNSSKPLSQRHDRKYIYMDIHERQGVISDPETHEFKRQKIDLKRPNLLALSIMTNPSLETLFNLREYIRGWRFYSSFNINNEKIQKSTPTSQEPVLNEDASNLSAVLFYLMTEHHEIFNELQSYIRFAIPGFKSLNVKARGGPGEVIAFWEEDGLNEEISLADLSDGIIRFICWATLCVMPSPPTLLCIDEPDQGVHPRTLPILAGLFQKAISRTQILLATHASYFLTQFDLENISVMKKINGESVFLKPSDSKALKANLEDFGVEEIEAMHRNDEMEALV
ncbi:AAA family ATPase [Candidatus Sumerlaeota bacterium]|nr:AAA family ATPase [Candidatus Sumerlaeota bacterium]